MRGEGAAKNHTKDVEGFCSGDNVCYFDDDPQTLTPPPIPPKMLWVRFLELEYCLEVGQPSLQKVLL